MDKTDWDSTICWLLNSLNGDGWINDDSLDRDSETERGERRMKRRVFEV